jgi:DNA-binding MarR family transcriptional regulator
VARSSTTTHIAGLDEALQRLRVAEECRSNELRTHTGLSDHDYAALRFVVDSTATGTPVGPKDIAAQLCISSASITVLIDRLETRGLLHRISSTVDRRAIILEATDAGHKIASTTTGADREYQRVLASVSPEDASQIMAFLSTLSNAIDPPH